jgi:hypothetical protein
MSEGGPFEAGAGETLYAKSPRSYLSNHEAGPTEDHQDRVSIYTDLSSLHS